MTTVKRRQEEPKEPKETKVPNFADKVADRVMRKLGTPPGFLKIKSIHLHDNRYRVNVYQKIVEEFQNLIIKNRICDSFYIVTDEEGEIVSPKIEKRY